jgi:hypothetical protein
VESPLYFALAFACPFVCHPAAKRRDLRLPLLSHLFPIEDIAEINTAL